MPPFKIVVTLLVFITLGIVVGSNLSVMMTVVVLNQGTKALPIGIWLIIAIASGILSSGVIQLLLFVQRRSTNIKIRQLQTRLQQQDEDIFTYTSSAEPEPVIVQESSRSPFRQSWRKPVETQPDNRPENRSPVEQTDTDNLDDWDEQRVNSAELDWAEVPPPRRDDREREFSSTESTRDNRDQIKVESARTDEVYDADFRLIQPPYKQPPAKFEYIEEDEDEEDEVEFEDQQSNRKGNLDDEDWGFDFDDEVAEIESKKAKSRKA